MVAMLKYVTYQAMPQADIATLFHHTFIIAIMKKAVSNYFAIATKGKAGLKTKDFEGGLAEIDEMSDKDNLKQLIQETINTTICKYSIKHQAVSGVPSVEEQVVKV
jgi:hypothetical protein